MTAKPLSANRSVAFERLRKTAGLADWLNAHVRHGPAPDGGVLQPNPVVGRDVPWPDPALLPHQVKKGPVDNAALMNKVVKWMDDPPTWYIRPHEYLGAYYGDAVDPETSERGVKAWADRARRSILNSNYRFSPGFLKASPFAVATRVAPGGMTAYDGFRGAINIERGMWTGDPKKAPKPGAMRRYPHEATLAWRKMSGLDTDFLKRSPVTQRDYLGDALAHEMGHSIMYPPGDFYRMYAGRDPDWPPPLSMDSLLQQSRGGPVAPPSRKGYSSTKWWYYDNVIGPNRRVTKKLNDYTGLGDVAYAQNYDELLQAAHRAKAETAYLTNRIPTKDDMLDIMRRAGAYGDVGSVDAAKLRGNYSDEGRRWFNYMDNWREKDPESFKRLDKYILRNPDFWDQVRNDGRLSPGAMATAGMG